MKEFYRFLDDLNFDEIKTNRKIKKVDNKLKKYIEEKILPENIYLEIYMEKYYLLQIEKLR